MCLICEKEVRNIVRKAEMYLVGVRDLHVLSGSDKEEEPLMRHFEGFERRYKQVDGVSA